MYNLYIDKGEVFECTINLEGASLNNAIARIIIESDDMNLMFNGNISSNGVCKVPIKKMKNLLPEGFTGNMKLEVIADDTYFSPWNSDCTIKASKSIKVEVKQQSSVIEEPKAKVTISEIKTNATPKTEQPKPETKPVASKKIITKEEKLSDKNKQYAITLSNLLKEKKITKKQLVTNKSVLKIVNDFMNETNIKNKILFIHEIKNLLK